MKKDYLNEEKRTIYEKLPNELKEVLFSEKTAYFIDLICQKNRIEDEEIPEVADCIGQVLLGFLNPNELQETLEKKLKLDKEIVKNLTKDIQREILYPVKSELEKLYGIEIFSPTEPTTITPLPEKKPKEIKKDIYREPIE